MPGPVSITPVGHGLHDVHVFPSSRRDRLMNQHRRDSLRVKGEPVQVNPYDKPAGIIAVLGAGNYSSSLEMVKAMFLENCAVVHKPHTLNIETDRVWAKIFAPLVDHGSLSFVERDPDRSAERRSAPVEDLLHRGHRHRAQDHGLDRHPARLRVWRQQPVHRRPR